MSEHDPRLIDYSLGIIDPEERRTLEAELARIPELRRQLAEVAETLAEYGGALSADEPSAALGERIRSITDPLHRLDGFTDRLCALFDLPGKRVHEILGHVAGAGEAPWQDPGLPGTHILDFEGGARVAQADCGLVRMQPGSVFPRHRHLGDEWALILEGQGREGELPCWYPGDLVHRAAGSEHGFRVVGDRPLVFAVVLHGGFELA